LMMTPDQTHGQSSSSTLHVAIHCPAGDAQHR
jgi:hypothetical protein